MSRQDRPKRTPVSTNLASLCLVVTLFCVVSAGQARDLPEHQIKAAFLFNLIAFVIWPDGIFESSATPLRYCSLDADAVGDTLEQLISGEKLDGRPLELVRIDNDTDTVDCHVLYVGGLSAYDAVVPVAREGDVLTVGDTEAFLQRGGMIALLHMRKRIHPAINLDAMEASSLNLSSKLLRLAKLVRSGKGD